MTTTETKGKSNWADDVEESEALPATTETTGADGNKTIVEWKLNDEGKKVKVTRKIKRTLQTQHVSHDVAERKGWAKFGAEKNSGPGPNNSTTTVGENMQFKLGVGKAAEETKEETDEAKALSKVKKIVCRLCKGDHFTSKCPYKETLEGIGMSNETPDFGADPTPGEAAGPSGGGIGGKYVPPSMRGAGSRPGPSADSKYPGPGGGGSRDDLPTLRVTNVSEDVEEDDLRELFQRAIGGEKGGRIARVYVGKDRETGQKKGYAFVSFESREVAQRAIDKVHGKGYANLILSVQWSAPRVERPAA